MGLEGSYEGTYLGMIDHNVSTITRALGGVAKGFHWINLMSSTAIPPISQSGMQDLSASEALSKNVPLKIRDLTVAYHRKPVIWDVDLTVPSAQLVGLVGPNGAGKSTLMKACLDLIPRTSGEVIMLGLPYGRVRQRVAYVPQRESVDWEFPVSALEVVTMGLYAELGWLRRVNKSAKARALAALERVGLAELAQHQIGQLSGGQQQRVFLARALVQSADLYFMDEPFAAVDAATERAIIEGIAYSEAARENGDRHSSRFSNRTALL